jgi:hypothetical protein
MLIALPHEEVLTYVFYRSIERYFVQAAASLPSQGLDVVDTCVVCGFAIPFIAVCFFKSIWNAWLTPKKNSENNSAALIETRAKLLYIKASLWLLTVTRFAHAHQQSTCQEPVRGSCLFTN